MEHTEGSNLGGPRHFLYDTLPPSSIRLLERTGRTSDGTLRFNIKAYNIDDTSLQYHCLSYTWGNPYADGVYSINHFNAVNANYVPENEELVLINGQPLHIQKNLHDALLDIPETVFIDDLNRPTGKEQTYLHSAAGQGLDGVVERRIKRGARVDIRDDDGRTALHCAAENGKTECVKILCKAGALRGAKDNQGRTAMEMAKAKSHQAVISALQSRSDQPDPEPAMFVKDLRGADSLIWVDAICINQNDIDEKSAQVSIMDMIYSRATFVVAWLGPEDDQFQAGLKTLKTLADHVEKFQESQIVPFGGHDKENYDSAGVPYISWEEWVALASIFQRQWFKRAWIVQEAVLPDVLLMYCGKHKMLWYELGAVAEALRRNEAKLGASRSKNFVPVGQIAVAVEWNMAEIYKWRTYMRLATGPDADKAQTCKRLMTLDELTRCFWTFLASNLRDKIYSLYGILNVFGEVRQLSDYRKSVASVYTSATRQIMIQAGDINLLSSCIFSPSRRQDIPSWVPDFGLPGINAIPDLFSADKGLEYHPPVADFLDQPTLMARGFRLGSIDQLAARQGANPREKFIFHPSWLRLVLSLKVDGEPETRQPLSAIFWRTLCMDMSYGSFFDAKKYGPRAPDTFGHQFKILMMVMILAAGDAQVLDHFGLPRAPDDRQATIILEPYNPFDEDLAWVLDELDKFTQIDGDLRCTPSREEVVVLWDSFQYTLSRLTRANADGSPVDVTLPPNVINGEARIVGNGIVETQSALFSSCLSFSNAYNVAYGGRQLFTLADQYLGLGPLSTQVGDEVWILPGLTTPAILRRAERSVDEALAEASLEENAFALEYHFVGAAYVHGIMRGEAVEGAGVQLEDIELV